jgi:hypothetical protein
VILEQRERKLLEALYDPLSENPTFAAKWVEEEGGRRYFLVTGMYTGSGMQGIDYRRTHSRQSILELEQDGYITRIHRGGDEFDLSITEAGIDLVESDFGRA